MNNADVTLDRITALELLDCLKSNELALKALDLDRVRAGSKLGPSLLTTETARIRQELERAIAERKVNE